MENQLSKSSSCEAGDRGAQARPEPAQRGVAERTQAFKQAGGPRGRSPRGEAQGEEKLVAQDLARLFERPGRQLDPVAAGVRATALPQGPTKTGGGTSRPQVAGREMQGEGEVAQDLDQFAVSALLRMLAPQPNSPQSWRRAVPRRKIVDAPDASPMRVRDPAIGRSSSTVRTDELTEKAARRDLSGWRIDVLDVEQGTGVARLAHPIHQIQPGRELGPVGQLVEQRSGEAGDLRIENDPEITAREPLRVVESESIHQKRFPTPGMPSIAQNSGAVSAGSERGP